MAQHMRHTTHTQGVRAHLSTERDSWRPCKSVKGFTPPLVVRNVQSVNGCCCIAELFHHLNHSEIGNKIYMARNRSGIGHIWGLNLVTSTLDASK